MSTFDVMKGDYCKTEIPGDKFISLKNECTQDFVLKIVYDILQEIFEGVFDYKKKIKETNNSNDEIRNPRFIQSYMREVDNLIDNLHCMQEPLTQDIRRYIQEIRSLGDAIHAAGPPRGQGDCEGRRSRQQEAAMRRSEGTLEHKKTSTNILLRASSSGVAATSMLDVDVAVDVFGEESADEEEMQVIELNDNEPVYLQVSKSEGFSGVQHDGGDVMPDPAATGDKLHDQKKKKKPSFGSRLVSFFTRSPSKVSKRNASTTSN